MKKNYRFSENNSRDKELLEFLKNAKNETELVKDALMFYKKAVEKRVIFDTNVMLDDTWTEVFDTAISLKLVSEDKEKVKASLIRQMEKDNKK